MIGQKPYTVFKFGFTHGYVKQLERKGLRFRKQGKDIMYDVNDVYEILELEKEVRKLRA